MALAGRPASQAALDSPVRAGSRGVTHRHPALSDGSVRDGTPDGSGHA